jgi:Ni/Co efflux regulator RcnB
VKTFIIAALAASVAASPVLAAPHHDNNGRGHAERDFRGHDNRKVVIKQVRRGPQVQYRDSWRKGERFESRYARNYQVIGNPGAYRLAPPPRGYRWVRSNNDAVLVGITSGVIASVIANQIR